MARAIASINLENLVLYSGRNYDEHHLLLPKLMQLH